MCFTGVSTVDSGLSHSRCLEVVTASIVLKSFLLCKRVSVSIAKSPVSNNSVFALHVLFTTWLTELEKTVNRDVSKSCCLPREDNTQTLALGQACAKYFQRITFRQVFLLFDGSSPSTQSEQTISERPRKRTVSWNRWISGSARVNWLPTISVQYWPAHCA